MQMGPEVHDSFFSRESDGIPIYRTPAQNLLVAMTLADSFIPPVDGPVEENHLWLVALLKTAVEQQNAATSSYGQLASRSMQCWPSGAQSHRITMDSSHPSRSTNQRPDAREDIDWIYAKRHRPGCGPAKGPRNVQKDIEAI